jgi:hypothetical protein
MENKQIFKAGDKVFSINKYIGTGDGWGILEKNNNSLNYPIKLGNHTYAEDGKFLSSDDKPSLFAYNPFESKERVVEVSNDGKIWEKRVLVKILNNHYYYPILCWSDATSIEESKFKIEITKWKYMREISDIKELTLKEISEKFNIPVDSIRIKD